MRQTLKPAEIAFLSELLSRARRIARIRGAGLDYYTLSELAGVDRKELMAAVKGSRPGPAALFLLMGTYRITWGELLGEAAARRTALAGISALKPKSPPQCALSAYELVYPMILKRRYELWRPYEYYQDMEYWGKKSRYYATVLLLGPAIAEVVEAQGWICPRF